MVYDMVQYFTVKEKVRFCGGTHFFEQGFVKFVEFGYEVISSCREQCEQRHFGTLEERQAIQFGLRNQHGKKKKGRYEVRSDEM